MLSETKIATMITTAIAAGSLKLGGIGQCWFGSFSLIVTPEALLLGAPHTPY